LLTPDDLRDSGLAALRRTAPAQKTRWDLYKGEHDLPYAPDGVNAEYLALREMARVPLVRLAIRTGVQRLRIDGIRLGSSDDRDKATWKVWQANRLDSLQRLVYVHGAVFGKGIVSVWPNGSDPDLPLIKVEDPRRVHVEPDPMDPFRPLWAVKTWDEARSTPLGVRYTAKCATLFDAEGFVWRWETSSPTNLSDVGAWDLVDVFDNPLGPRVPFVVFAPEMDADGDTLSMVDPLVPMQRSIDTIRFDLLLAAQFAAYRQRVVVGYDPVLRDEDGNPVVKTDDQGNPILDEHGMAQPVTASPGRVGVDRLMVFPGADTKVFDLAESNLANYVTALDMLLATFAATAQVPSQYLAGDFKNVSGDLMVATEATLLSLVKDLQTAYSDSWEEVFSLANIARGEAELPLGTEVVWADEAPKDISVVASAMAQMVPNGAPARMFLEMLPGATQAKVERWMGMSANALQRALAGDLAGALTGPKEAPVVDDAPEPVPAG
jgi:hypothetical protein